MKVYAKIEKWRTAQKLGEYTTDDLGNLLEDFENLEACEKLVISPVDMDEEEYAKLPEFTGW